MTIFKDSKFMCRNYIFYFITLLAISSTGNQTSFASNLAPSNGFFDDSAILSEDDVQRYINGLSNNFSQQYYFKAKALIFYGSQPIVIQELILSLDNDDSLIRISSEFILFSLNYHRSARLDSILNYIIHGTDLERKRLLELILSFDTPSDYLINNLLLDIKDNANYEIREFSFELLLTKFINDDVINSIGLSILNDDDRIKFKATGWIIGGIHRNPSCSTNPILFRIICELANDDTIGIRLNAIRALPNLSEKESNIEIISSIIINDEDKLARTVAYTQLARISPELCDSSVVINNIYDENYSIQIEGMRALSYLTPNSEYIDELTYLLRSNPSNNTAHSILRRWASCAQDAVPTLIDIIYNNNGIGQKCEAIITLGYIGRKRLDAVDTLETLLESDDPVILTNTLSAISNIGEIASPLIPKVIEILRNAEEYSSVYIKAIYFLGNQKTNYDMITSELAICLNRNIGTFIEIDIRLALYRLNYNKEENFNIITESLYCEDWNIMERGLWAITELSNDTHWVLPRLYELISYAATHTHADPIQRAIFILEDNDSR